MILQLILLMVLVVDLITDGTLLLQQFLVVSIFQLFLAITLRIPRENHCFCNSVRQIELLYVLDDGEDKLVIHDSTGMFAP